LSETLSSPSAFCVILSAIGSQGRSVQQVDLFPHPPFNPCVRFSRTRLSDGRLDIITLPLDNE